METAARGLWSPQLQSWNELQAPSPTVSRIGSLTCSPPLSHQYWITPTLQMRPLRLRQVPYLGRTQIVRDLNPGFSVLEDFSFPQILQLSGS